MRLPLVERIVVVVARVACGLWLARESAPSDRVVIVAMVVVSICHARYDREYSKNNDAKEKMWHGRLA